MTGKILVDTHVLVYAYDLSEPESAVFGACRCKFAAPPARFSS
ncbi:MAG: hypothetical protein PWQ39_99 [Thermacetogenium sp.]|nr:hypothetical protein [Thermacetogenium sp.]